MHTPNHFKQTELSQLRELIQKSGIGTLVTFGMNGIEASHIPMFLEANEESPMGILYGHMAKANGQWKRFSAQSPALAIFLGPNAYVTPSWYATKKQTGKVVPTWNYMAV
ncbi:MAG: FMN-binding negative transcriptional regulator, partial [Myxococcota bacterium]